MILPPLHLPLISAGFFGAVVSRMLAFVGLRIRRSDQGMAPSLSPELRAQTVALHGRLAVLTREFHRLAELARQGRLRVYPDRRSPVPRPDDAADGPGGPDPEHRVRANAAARPASGFDQPPLIAQGPTLPAMPTRGFGWMLGFVPAEYGPAVATLLTNPEMVSLIQASPAVARLVRPLCRGLGVAPPDGVFPPLRPRRPRARPVARGPSGGVRDARGAVDPAARVPALGRHRGGDVAAGPRALVGGAARRDRAAGRDARRIAGARPARETLIFWARERCVRVVPVHYLYDGRRLRVTREPPVPRRGSRLARDGEGG